MFESNCSYPQKDTHDYPLPSFFKYNKCLSAFSGTDDFIALGDGYTFFDEITVDAITGENGNVIKPRVEKSKEEWLYESLWLSFRYLFRARKG